MAKNTRSASGGYSILHSPHPAERHVLDHEATKAAIVDQTGLKATTDVISPSASTPKDIFLGGIKIPQRPKPPESDGTSTTLAHRSLLMNDYRMLYKEARNARGRLRELSIPMHEWPGDLQKQEMKEVTASNEEEKEGLDNLDLDPTMKAFLMLEKQLGKR
ncbi:oxidoreductase family protein [Rhizoctonia solani]|uniref:Oxidoreductase family protein n=1 Tax=Rhizoctonia solani TaxID=456999 RepID=A0A8H8P3N0_9AGAM|nr:oxidoreductase family protein [Rhizoctonia solani]QRW23213.1 oxidoreductase family protein [Rhizoctonia solani]